LNIDIYNAGFWNYDIPSGEVTCSESWIEKNGLKTNKIKIFKLFRIIVTEYQEWIIDNMENILFLDKKSLECCFKIKKNTDRLFYIKGEVMERDRNNYPLKLAGIVLSLSKETDEKILISKIIEEKDTKKKVSGYKSKAPLNKDYTKTESGSYLQWYHENFLSHLNHELRTPLNGIIGLSSILKSEIRLDPYNLMAEKVYSSAKRLLGTYTKLLKIAEIEAGVVKCGYSVFDIDSFIKRIAEGFEKEIAEKKLLLKTDFKQQELKISSDKELLSLAIGNLIENSIKFTEKGEIKITVSLQNHQGMPYTAIRISDTGIGITENKAEVIYNSFYEADQREFRKFESNGLGLYLVKKIILLLKAEIKFKSKENVGTEFTVFLPV